MRRERLYYIISFIVVALVFIAVALYQRFSWNDMPNTHIEFSDYLIDVNEYTPKPPLPSLIELIAESETIISATSTDNHLMQEYSVLTEVIVNEVYKGDINLVGQSIYVYEPFIISNQYAVSDGGYMLMLPQSEYILFLNFFEQPSGYRYSDADKNTYLLSKIQWSKFHNTTEHNTMPYKPNPDDYSCYEEIKNYVFLSYSQEEIDAYTDLHEQVLYWITGLENNYNLEQPIVSQ